MNLKTIDCETGGFDCEECALTQVAVSVLDIDTLKIVGEYKSHIKVYGNKRYDQEALDATRLTLDILNQKGQEPQVVMKQLDEFLKIHSPKTQRNHKDRSIFVGHNPLFDIGFLNVFFREYSKNTTLETYFNGKQFDKYFVPTHLDTVVLAKMMLGTKQTPNFQLGTVLEKFEIEMTDAHDAMNDVRGTENLTILGINKLRSIGKSSSNTESEEQVGHRFRTTFEIA